MIMELLEILKKHVDEKALAQDLIVQFVAPKLKELAAKSDNTLDDALVNMILEALKA